MKLLLLHDKKIIYDFLKQSPALQLFCIGDLDDFFWPKTTWYALQDQEGIKSIALFYVGMETPTLLLFEEHTSPFSIQLLQKIKHLLPQKFNAHFSTGLLDVYGRQNIVIYYGLSYKMTLKKAVAAPDYNTAIRRLNTEDIPSIVTLLSLAYPQSWFDSRMIQTDQYWGYFQDGQLVGVAGIHVYSEEYKVAALGNVATHPEYRGQKIAHKLVSTLCADLQKRIEIIGLNVRAENKIAIRCYENIGFEISGTYDECYYKNETA
jgi:predicted GNAT family acetyltransferase